MAPRPPRRTPAPPLYFPSFFFFGFCGGFARAQTLIPLDLICRSFLLRVTQSASSRLLSAMETVSHKMTICGSFKFTATLCPGAGPSLSMYSSKTLASFFTRSNSLLAWSHRRVTVLGFDATAKVIGFGFFPPDPPPSSPSPLPLRKSRADSALSTSSSPASTASSSQRQSACTGKKRKQNLGGSTSPLWMPSTSRSNVADRSAAPNSWNKIFPAPVILTGLAVPAPEVSASASTLALFSLRNGHEARNPKFVKNLPDADDSTRRSMAYSKRGSGSPRSSSSLPAASTPL
mmetsp:Transcript_3786/g.9808  ORF Transcript_3786/g.9808 Transcript_3786/m.9808 type:complete len:290 (+) Transcript_3786:420-1289(+)